MPALALIWRSPVQLIENQYWLYLCISHHLSFAWLNLCRKCHSTEITHRYVVSHHLLRCTLNLIILSWIELLYDLCLRTVSMIVIYKLTNFNNSRIIYRKFSFLQFANLRGACFQVACNLIRNSIRKYISISYYW